MLHFLHRGLTNCFVWLKYRFTNSFKMGQIYEAREKLSTVVPWLTSLISFHDNARNSNQLCPLKWMQIPLICSSPSKRLTFLYLEVNVKSNCDIFQLEEPWRSPKPDDAALVPAVAAHFEETAVCDGEDVRWQLAQTPVRVLVHVIGREERQQLIGVHRHQDRTCECLKKKQTGSSVSCLLLLSGSLYSQS